MNRRNINIDLFKFIASLMIVAIHTMRTFNADSGYGFFLINILCRIAVPFFAVCSGYYLSSECALGEHDTKIKKAVCKQEVKLCRLYALWSAVYLLYSIPMWIEIGWFSLYAFVDYGIGAVIVGSHYHLWYLLSLIYALPLFSLMVFLFKKIQLVVASIVLWIIKSVIYGYQCFLPDSAVRIVQMIDKIPSIRDALFCILPLLLLGAIVRTENKKKYVFYLMGFAISFCGLCAEAFYLKSYGQLAVSYIFFTYPTAYFLFHVISDADLKKNSTTFARFGKISMLVYCVHPIIGEITDRYLLSNFAHFAVTAIGATLLGLFIMIVDKKQEVKKCLV